MCVTRCSARGANSVIKLSVSDPSFVVAGGQDHPSRLIYFPFRSCSSCRVPSAVLLAMLPCTPSTSQLERGGGSAVLGPGLYTELRFHVARMPSVCGTQRVPCLTQRSTGLYITFLYLEGIKLATLVYIRTTTVTTPRHGFGRRSPRRHRVVCLKATKSNGRPFFA